MCLLSYLWKLIFLLPTNFGKMVWEIWLSSYRKQFLFVCKELFLSLPKLLEGCCAIDYYYFLAPRRSLNIVFYIIKSVFKVLSTETYNTNGFIHFQYRNDSLSYELISSTAFQLYSVKKLLNVSRLLLTSDPPRLRSSDKHIIGTNMFCLL